MKDSRKLSQLILSKHVARETLNQCRKERKCLYHAFKRVFFFIAMFQLMVNCWFGLVAWIFRIPWWKGSLLRGTPRMISPMTRFSISDLAGFDVSQSRRRFDQRQGQVGRHCQGAQHSTWSWFPTGNMVLKRLKMQNKIVEHVWKVTNMQKLLRYDVWPHEPIFISFISCLNIMAGTSTPPITTSLSANTA